MGAPAKGPGPGSRADGWTGSEPLALECRQTATRCQQVAPSPPLPPPRHDLLSGGAGGARAGGIGGGVVALRVGRGSSSASESDRPIT